MKIEHEGKEIEVFTQEEIAEQIEAAKQEVAEKTQQETAEKFSDYDEVKQQTSDLQTKLQEAQELLKAAEDNPAKKAQIERLRGERDEAKKNLDIFRNEIDDKIQSIRSEFMGDYKSELLNKVASGDQDLQKKISLEFDRYRPSDNDRDSVRQRMERAYILATGQAASPGIFDGGVMSGGSGSGAKQEKNTRQVSDNAVKIGSMLGVSEDDRKAYLAKKNKN